MSCGKLVVIAGPMFAGKSAHLIAESKKHVSTLNLAPAFDTRSGAFLHSREGSRLPARSVSEWPRDARDYAHAVIDEVHFLAPPFYAGDAVADILAARAAGLHLTVGGLDTDYLRKPFDITRRLMAAADRVCHLEARCHVCDAPARWTAKKRETGQVLETGDGELYEARCDAHWTTPEGA